MVSHHTSRQYDNDMDGLRERLLGMGALAVTQLQRISEALTCGAKFTVDEIAETERAINQEHIDIDGLCTRIIVKRQPAAVDLRVILSTIHVINDLERVGDESKKILRKLSQLPTIPNADFLAEMRNMGAITHDMLARAVQCVRRQDSIGAYEVLRLDERVDTEFGAAMARIEAALKADTAHSAALLDFAFIAKSMERCGDHAKNVAEEVIAMVRGEDIRHRAPQH